VVSVGNLSVGGTGKTPLVALLAARLLAQGERPAILSRGYGRRDRRDGVVVVSDGETVRAGLDEAGDEPLMLARAVPGAIVAVCEDRHLAGVLAERRLGATLHLLDDGFQHVQLARDVDILVTFPGEITQGRVLPFGRLRESAAAAARAHFVVIVDADEATARSEAWELGISQFATARRVLVLDALRGGASDVRGLPGGARDAGTREDVFAEPVFAVAGIARPDRFFAMLQDAGVRVAGTRAFADHHLYTDADVESLDRARRAAGAGCVVTTVKDAVRFEPLGELPFALHAVPMTLQVEGWDALEASIAQALARARAREAS
jgi:tetraacyldisaccharide 4'-kinase